MQVSIAESSWPLDVAGCPQLETPRSGEISMEIAWYRGLGWVHIPKLPYISVGHLMLYFNGPSASGSIF